MNNKITFSFDHFNIEKENPGIYDIIFCRRDNIGNFKDADPTVYRFSQVVDSILHYLIHTGTAAQEIGLVKDTDLSDEDYIISTAVAYAPADWTDTSQSKTNKSIFEYLSDRYIKDLQCGKAMLLIDQSVEGYAASWLWAWFHNKCDRYKIDPNCIIYFTGDQSCTDDYNRWCLNKGVKPQLNVFPSTSLGMYVRQHYERNNLNINFLELLEYKKNKNDMYLYDCTNMRPRTQRMLNFLHLFNEGLLDVGNISMPAKSTWGSMGRVDPGILEKYGLPRDIMDKIEDRTYIADHEHDNTVEHYWMFVERILHEMYRNSWVSLIAESSYFKHENSVFISEKTFKPLACLQPFIIVGSKNSLKYLRKLGFKTFHPFIDESYDDFSDEQRFKKITESVKKIQAIEDKGSWYESMKDILEHNQQLFLSITKVEPAEFTAVKNCYSKYFNKENVQNAL